MREKQQRKQVGSSPQGSGFGPAEAAAPARLLTALDIQQKEFRVSRFGGYRMRDVDEFLDALTDAMAALTSENERLRRGAGPPIVGTPDLDEVSRQADEIITRAREEAARIIADAEERAANVETTSAGPEGRAAIEAFLAQERAFLQGMAALVQDHAETVKAMARRSRQHAAPPPVSPRGPDDREPPPAPAPEVTRDRAPDAAMDEPIVVEEPQPAAARRDDRPAEGDPSLRELFWGEGDEQG
jgi:DivIVA domain-containing protein